MSSSCEAVGVEGASMVLATLSMLDMPENVFLITLTGAPCFPMSAITSPNSATVEATFCKIPVTLSTLDGDTFTVGSAPTGASTFCPKVAAATSALVAHISLSPSHFRPPKSAAAASSSYGPRLLSFLRRCCPGGEHVKQGKQPARSLSLETSAITATASTKQVARRQCGVAGEYVAAPVSTFPRFLLRDGQVAKRRRPTYVRRSEAARSRFSDPSPWSHSKRQSNNGIVFSVRRSAATEEVSGDPPSVHSSKHDLGLSFSRSPVPGVPPLLNGKAEPCGWKRR
nr:hypothetical protein Iba_chr13cCG15230 [Ipomoea batatas]